MSLYIFFSPVIKLAKLWTFRFHAPQSCNSNDKGIACLREQPPCVWAGININRIIINKDRTSNLLCCISVACDTAQYRGFSSYVCPVHGTFCDFLGTRLPSYENISKLLLLDKENLMNGSRVKCIYGRSLTLYKYEIKEKIYR